MSFRLGDHTADIAVEATGRDLNAVFGAVADGMAAAHVEPVPDSGDRFSLAVSAEGREALLFDYLDTLIYERDVRGVLPVENDATVARTDDEWTCEATARGVPLSEISASEVKAVTYSEMDLSETEEGWHAYVVLDM